MNFLLVFFIFSLQNFDFEEWQNSSPLYWNVEHPQALPVFKDSGNVYSGNYSVVVKRESPTTSYRTAISQEIDSITGGLEYNFGIYVFDNDTNVYARIVITWYKDSNYLTYSITPPSQDLNSWQVISAIRQAPDTANRAIFKINIYPQNSNDTGRIFYDLAGFYCCSTKESPKPVIKRAKKKTAIITRKFRVKSEIFDIFGRKRKSIIRGIYFDGKRKVIYLK